MKIAFARFYVKNGDFAYNFGKIKELYVKAVEKNLDIVIFPRLALTGFCINDSFLDEKFLEKFMEYFEKILDLSLNNDTKMIIGSLFYEKSYQENNIIHKSMLKDSVFFIDKGYIDTISCRKLINKDNVFNDYRYFDTENILTQIIYNKKKFSVLISDDIFSNFNVFLTSDNKPDYILCFDSSLMQLEQKKKHLLKLAKFANSPVFYLNSTNNSEYGLFMGEIILINEDFELVYEDSYIQDNLLEFEIDCEDGSELYIKKNNNLKYDISYVLEHINGYINIDNFSETEIQNILNNKKLKCLTFDNNNKYNVKYLDIYKYVDKNLYDVLEIETQNKIKNKLINLLNKTL